MKLIFESSNEYESLVTAVDIDIDGLKDLKTKIGIVEKAVPDAVRVAFPFSDIEVSEGCWDEDFDPSEEGNVRIAWSNVVVSKGSILWEFGIKHVDGHYEAPWIGEKEIEDLIENPRDVWYGPRIQDELDDLKEEEQGSGEWYRKEARRNFEEGGVVEIDPEAEPSRGDDKGAYVMAWVWVECEMDEEEENGQEYREPAPNERQADGSRHTPGSLFAAQVIDANKSLEIDRLKTKEES